MGVSEFILYRTIDPVTGEFYVGKHECTCGPPCGYRGSGNWVKSHPRRRQLLREDLGYYPDAEALAEAERQEVDFFKCDPLCRNLADGGKGFTASTAKAHWANRTKAEGTARALKAWETRRQQEVPELSVPFPIEER